MEQMLLLLEGSTVQLICYERAHATAIMLYTLADKSTVDAEELKAGGQSQPVQWQDVTGKHSKAEFHPNRWKNIIF